jgi:Protein of unknown function (DUF1559)
MLHVERLVSGRMTRREWLLFAVGAAGAGASRFLPQQAGFPGATPADREMSVKNLKHIGVAFHNYHAANGRFPAQAILGGDGQPLLSWRVAILPFLAQQELYERFRCDEPWDSEHNKKLLAAMPDAYAPVGPRQRQQRTFYQGFVGEGAFFELGRGATIADISDGTVNTLMVVEGAKTVPWTRPEDLPFGRERPLPHLGGLYKGGFHALTCAGEVHFLPKKIDTDLLCSAISRNDGEVGVRRRLLEYRM